MTATLPLAPAQAVRFHLSLNVSDLSRSVAFYRILFGVEPAKLRGDYAKFELDDPPLVLSLEPTPRAAGGPLNHLGFRLPDAPTLVAMQERLERAGIRSQREEGVECCYARQTKFWVTDPDQTLWEIYTLEGDIEHRGVGQSLEEMLPHANGKAAEASAEPVVWEHRLTEPVPVASKTFARELEAAIRRELADVTTDVEGLEIGLVYDETVLRGRVGRAGVLSDPADESQPGQSAKFVQVV